MKLEEAWNLVESLNEDANQKSKNLWNSNNIKEAIDFQTTCFKKNFLQLDNDVKQELVHWMRNDDEFLDYIECFLGEEFVKSLL